MPRALRTAGRFAVLCWAISLLSPSLAAAEGERPLSDPLVSRYLQVAWKHWGGAPPTCTEPNGEIVQVHAVLFDDPDPGVSARAQQPGCRIFLDRDFWPARRSAIDCTIIVHEWGHLLGFGHSEDPRSLMYETPVSGAPGCALFSERAVAAKRVRARRAKRSQQRKAHQRRAAARRRAVKRRMLEKRHRRQNARRAT